MTPYRQFCTFYVEGLHFGVDVLYVQEVLRYQTMTRVPGAPAMVRGLINLRGQIVTAVDLRTRLELGAAPTTKPPMNVVVRTEDDTVAVLVDEIGDVIDAPDAAFEDTPLTLRGPVRDLVNGVYKLDDGLLLVLDPIRALGDGSEPRAG